MAIADSELIGILISEDTELRFFVEEHRKLDDKIKSLDQRRFLTPVEEMQRKTLQKKKLAGKDRIENILFKYKRNERVIY